MIGDLFSAQVLLGILTSGIRLATPYLYAGIGETFSQRSGVLNLGVDGQMLMGAFAGFYVVFSTGNLWLGLLAGAPTILGAWIGGYTTSDVLAVLFFAIAAGAAFQVVLEVGRYVARHAPDGVRSGYAIGGFLAGIVAMYVTGILAG